MMATDEERREAAKRLRGDDLPKVGLIKRCSAHVERPDNRQQPR